MSTQLPAPGYTIEQVWPPFSEALLDWDDSFHDLMLNDHIRMVAYRKAIFESVKPGMTVLDLGTGTGILSLWALEAGAKHVYGVDLSEDILRHAVDRIKTAGFGDRFTAINQLSFDVKLDEPVDMLISEIMGNMADNEDFQPIIEDAIQRLLKPGGVVLPEYTQSYIVPVAALEAHSNIKRRNIASFSSKYGIDNMLQEKGIQSPFNIYYDCILAKSSYLSTSKLLRTYQGNWKQDSVYTTELQFTVESTGIFTGFKAYFITKLSQYTHLDISGDDIAGRTTSDSWKHSYLPVENAIECEAGDTIQLYFSRSYPDKHHSQHNNFRQIYQWSGKINRRGKTIAQFNHCMDESRLQHGNQKLIEN